MSASASSLNQYCRQPIYSTLSHGNPLMFSLAPKFHFTDFNTSLPSPQYPTLRKTWKGRKINLIVWYMWFFDVPQDPPVDFFHPLQRNMKTLIAYPLKTIFIYSLYTLCLHVFLVTLCFSLHRDKTNIFYITNMSFCLTIFQSLGNIKTKIHSSIIIYILQKWRLVLQKSFCYPHPYHTMFKPSSARLWLQMQGTI